MARKPKLPFPGIDLRKLARIAVANGITYTFRRKTGEGVFYKKGHGMLIFNRRRKDTSRKAVAFVKKCMTAESR